MIRIARFISILFVPFFFVNNSYSQSIDSTIHRSEYIGQENRYIKSLSMEDIEELRAGKGWGLAKVAELNGVPGPGHVLDMADEISLTDIQEEKIAALFEKMNKQAR